MRTDLYGSMVVFDILSSVRRMISFRIYLMKRLVLVLCTFVSPVWAIGFWQDVKLGVASGGANRICVVIDLRDPSWQICEDISTSGILFGGSANVGISLHPLAPFALGLGLDYYMGNLTYKFENAEGTSKTSRLYIKLPLAYQISFLNIKSRIGLYPAYSIYTVYGENESFPFKGFSFGIFGDMYYQMGFLGFGGGVFMDYGPKLGSKDVEISVLQYGINLGINLSFGILE